MTSKRQDSGMPSPKEPNVLGNILGAFVCMAVVGLLAWISYASYDHPARKKADDLTATIRAGATEQELARAGNEGMMLTALITRSPVKTHRLLGKARFKLNTERSILARLLNLDSYHDILDMERGVRPMSAEQIDRLCTIYEVPPTWFTSPDPAIIEQVKRSKRTLKRWTA